MSDVCGSCSLTTIWKTIKASNNVTTTTSFATDYRHCRSLKIILCIVHYTYTVFRKCFLYVYCVLTLTNFDSKLYQLVTTTFKLIKLPKLHEHCKAQRPTSPVVPPINAIDWTTKNWISAATAVMRDHAHRSMTKPPEPHWPGNSL